LEGGLLETWLEIRKRLKFGRKGGERRAGKKRFSIKERPPLDGTGFSNYSSWEFFCPRFKQVFGKIFLFLTLEEKYWFWLDPFEKKTQIFH